MRHVASLWVLLSRTHLQRLSVCVSCFPLSFIQSWEFDICIKHAYLHLLAICWSVVKCRCNRDQHRCCVCVAGLPASFLLIFQLHSGLHIYKQYVDELCKRAARGTVQPFLLHLNLTATSSVWGVLNEKDWERYVCGWGVCFLSLVLIITKSGKKLLFSLNKSFLSTHFVLHTHTHTHTHSHKYAHSSMAENTSVQMSSAFFFIWQQQHSAWKLIALLCTSLCKCTGFQPETSIQ